MWPYWMMFGFIVCRVFMTWRSVGVATKSSIIWSGWWLILFCMLVLFIGLRVEVGADWFNYLPMVQAAEHQTLGEATTRTDPAYGVLNWFGARSGLGIYFVNTICATLFSWGLISFCRSQPRPWLTLAVAAPYLIIVVAMGYTRQGVAIGLAMIGLVSLDQGKLFRFIFWIACAASFHKSALILLPLAALASAKHRFWVLFWIAIATTMLYILLLLESMDRLVSLYIEREMDSSGAVIRIAMNALPAACFLLFRERFHLLRAQKSFWFWMSWSALAFVPLLALSPSSTLLDRVALYWIPLQLFVWARLPDALGRTTVVKTSLVLMVTMYCAAILLVWMVFATNADAWLPYNFYLAN